MAKKKAAKKKKTTPAFKAATRVAGVFDRLVHEYSMESCAAWSDAERFVFVIVATRCDIDIGGFASIYEQTWTFESEHAALVAALQAIEEPELADEFQTCHDLLAAKGYYQHRNWNRVSAIIKKRIQAIGERIGDRLWDLDEKLNVLLDRSPRPPASR